jgi:hypothetical protein
MGFDCGFDIYPPLESTAPVKETYRQFRDEIMRKYENIYDQEGRRTDGRILEIPTNSDNKVHLSLMVGECPHMPYDPDHCCYFLRSSSKISGHLTTPAEPYIRDVHKIAKKYFGSRVYFWHELCETGDERQWGYYDWADVHKAEEKLRELERQEPGQPKHALEEQRKAKESNLDVELLKSD